MRGGFSMCERRCVSHALFQRWRSMTVMTSARLLAQVAPAFAVLVLELEPVFLELEEAAVDVEQVGRPQVGLVDQFPLGVAQNFFQIDRRHRKHVSAPRRQFNGELRL